MQKLALVYTASWSTLSLNKTGDNSTQDNTCKTLTSQRPSIDINDLSVYNAMPSITFEWALKHSDKHD